MSAHTERSPEEWIRWAGVALELAEDCYQNGRSYDYWLDRALVCAQLSQAKATTLAREVYNR